MINGFKEFILRGNVIELAVAVVIGAAFTSIVTVLVEALINPLIGLFFNAGSLDEALQVKVETLGGGVSVFSFGLIIGAVINFLAVALVVYFVFVMPMNKAKERADRLRPAVVEPAPLPSEAELLVEIRDLLQSRRSV
ncbi:large conductance mechanosensitive channel protein MscL [Microbacterium sp. SA39]|uniref:large conductance mechanosensitive channel protein MscL n=1 Tax=Microbacterium sp. SA39 TaxID=1263625 RepID=UPI0005FA00A1|nr:large conductance mechanosensitive channel protein MscL [Microbacterium sp. SA39]KJQ52848.1 Large-conductance mechanosensitive channel [Microbacterium sp. SA39]